MAGIGSGRAGGPLRPPGAGSRPAPEPLAPEVLSAPVLIVEDEAMIAWMLESLLEEMGFSAITIAATGSEAIDAAARVAPGLIVSDINLGPGELDGIAAAATITKTCPIDVLFITGHAGADALDRISRDVPRSRVLRKPVDPEELHRAVVGLVEHRRRN